jgi:hypothetical protein
MKFENIQLYKKRPNDGVRKPENNVQKVKDAIQKLKAEIQKSSDASESLDKTKIFEKIKTPDELLVYMQGNIKYGYVGKNNQKAYTPDNEDMDSNFLEEYYLQTPEELLESKHGVCWDDVELEREWFSKQNYEFKTFLLIFAKESSNNLPTHTFLAYKNNDKFYWFESAFKQCAGIHEFENLNDLFEDVKAKQLDYAIKNSGATSEDFKDLKLCEYEAPTPGCGAEEFIFNIINKNPSAL